MPIVKEIETCPGMTTPFVDQSEKIERMQKEIDRLSAIEQELGRGVMRMCSQAARYRFVRDALVEDPLFASTIVKSCSSQGEIDSKIDHLMEDKHRHTRQK